MIPKYHLDLFPADSVPSLVDRFSSFYNLTPPVKIILSCKCVAEFLVMEHAHVLKLLYRDKTMGARVTALFYTSYQQSKILQAKECEKLGVQAVSSHTSLGSRPSM